MIRPKPISILQTTIHPVRMPWLMQYIADAIKERRKVRVFPMNAHIVAELYKDPAFKAQHETADAIFCDGTPIVWLSKFTQSPLPERVSGTDLVEGLLRRGHKTFLLGSTDAVLERMRRRFPSICGTFSPPHQNTWSGQTNKGIVARINRSGANIVMVGVGPLKQERWICEFRKSIRAPVCIGVGSAFDILSGKTPRAPAIVQRAGCEWIWRIALEPKRLLRRYIADVMTIAKLLATG